MSIPTRFVIIVLLISNVLYGQNDISINSPIPMNSSNSTKMKVEVWSDIMCPFCYIGKRHYEAALKQFADSNRIEIEWKSFQLDPTIPKNPENKNNVYKYLADRKGMSEAQSRKMHDNVVEMAKQAGLSYNFDNAVIANSFDAHKMIQLAKTKGLGDEAEERLFRAYFIEGMDFGDAATLVKIGQEIGLEGTEIEAALLSDDFAYKVKSDIAEAAQLGVQGVPFFVFNRKYAVSGAQPTEAFLETMQKSFLEWEKSNPKPAFEVIEGPVCKPDGKCY
jgi:protein disulfide-isomerase